MRMMRIRKAWLVGITFLMTLAFVGSAYAGTALFVQSGTLAGPTTSALGLGIVTLNAGPLQQTSTGQELLTVTDSRGSGAGWSVNVASTDFQVTGVTDPTKAGATLTCTLPAASTLKVAPATATTVSGQPVSGMTMNSGAFVSNAGLMVWDTLAGNGMGSYQSYFNYTFYLPFKFGAGACVSTDSTTSAYKSGNTQTPGLFAGQYVGTVSYTTNNTP